MSLRDVEHGNPQSSKRNSDASAEKTALDHLPELIDEKSNTATESGPSDFPEGGWRAWLVVAGTAGVMFCNFGYANAFGVYQEYYATHQLSHETASAISWIGSLQVFLLFGGMVFSGPLFDRYGTWIIWPPAITYLISIFLTSICTKLWHFMLCQGILGGLSMGLTSGPCMAACGHYFQKKRGAALGLAIAGSSLGGVIFPLALSKMLNNPRLSYGWTVRICGFLILAVSIPSISLVRARLPPRTGTLFLPRAFKEPQYVSIVVSMTFLLLGLFTPFFYLPSYAVEHGMSNILSGYLVAILNGASFFGRVVPGILADKIGPLNMLFAASISTGLLIFCWQAITTSAGIIVFSALYGFCSGAIISLNSFAIANVPKNPQNIGTYMGMGMAVSALAVLIGPPINGALVTNYHGYTPSMDFSGASVCIGAGGILIARYFKGKGLWAKI